MQRLQEVKNHIVSPLTPIMKERILEELKKIKIEELKPALVAAALKGLEFPKAISQTLISLQTSHLSIRGHEEIAAHARKMITSYIEKIFIECFQKFLQEPFKEEDWHSAFLLFLKDFFDIQVDEEPLVEAQILQGKIYWRIVKGTAVIYDRQQAKNKPFDFCPESTWRMSWDLFRVFKDSGKRHSSVAITKELFVAQFKNKSAPALWDELKQKRVLNHRNRLSHGWRALSNDVIQFSSVKGEENKNVIKAIYSITNNPDNKETFSFLPQAAIYRPERTLKKTTKNGLIQNDLANSQKLTLVKQQTISVWDVTVYSDGSAHEKKAITELNDTIQLDHVPSTCILNDTYEQTQTYVVWQDGNNELAEKQKKLKKLEEESEKRMDEITQDSKKITTRQEAKIQSDSIMQAIQQEIDKCNKQIKTLASEQNEMQKLLQNKNHFWTIALPFQLHKQGLTFMQSKKEQKAATDTHLLKEMKVYFAILETRGKEFFKNPEMECIKALGAFRYLYRMNLKNIPNVKDMHKIGNISQSLFHNPKVRKEIDQFFLEKIKKFLDKREGYYQEDAKEVSNARKKLPFTK